MKILSKYYPKYQHCQSLALKFTIFCKNKKIPFPKNTLFVFPVRRIAEYCVFNIRRCIILIKIIDSLHIYKKFELKNK